MRVLTVRNKTWMRLVGTAGLVVWVGAGCGSGGSSVSLATACTDLATSQCGMQQSCDPRGFEVAFADLASCVARLQLPCPIIASAPGSGYSAGSIESCATAMASTSCADFLNNVGPTACRIRGSLPLGAPCVDDAQCAGVDNFCSMNGRCGVCAPRKPLTDVNDPFAFGSCARNEGCQDSLVCTLSLCAQPLPAGATCDLTHPCQWPSACVGTTCGPATLGAGAPCDLYASGCDPNQRLVCADEDIDVCIQIPAVHRGEVCGLMGNLVTQCLDGMICDVLSGDYLGTCQPPLADGAPCDDAATVYDRCQPPASCTDGFCNLIEPLACTSADGGID
jgi:hypothetical protein